MKSHTLAVIALLFTTFTAQADERLTGDTEILLGSISFHTTTAPSGRNWNNTNPSVGLKAYFANEAGIEFFARINAVGSNQTGGQTFDGGFGLQYRLFKTSDLSLVIGGVIGGQSYGNDWINTRTITPVGYSFLGVTYRKFTLEGSYHPEVNYNGTQIPAYAALNIGLHFR